MADVTGTTYAGEAFIGYMSELRIGQGDSPETFVAVADVTLITPGDMTTGVIEKTHLRSPDRHREWLLTLRDSGAFTIVGNYRPGHGSHTVGGGDGFDPNRSLVSLWRDATEANFEIELPGDAAGGGSPNGIILPFRGGVIKYQIGALGIDVKVDFTAEIKPLQGYELP
jgi:hypothetical protein